MFPSRPVGFSWKGSTIKLLMVLAHWGDWEWDIQRGDQIQRYLQLVLDFFIYLLFKFRFLLVLQPTVVNKLTQRFDACLKPVCCAVYFTAGHFCSSFSSALWVVVVLLLLPVLETQGYDTCLKTTIPRALFLCVSLL